MRFPFQISPVKYSLCCRHTTQHKFGARILIKIEIVQSRKRASHRFITGSDSAAAAWGTSNKKRMVSDEMKSFNKASRIILKIRDSEMKSTILLQRKSALLPRSTKKSDFCMSTTCLIPSASVCCSS